MTLPSSPPISMSQIAAEFGGSAPHSLTEYYRGGGLVPTHSGTNGIPTSGTISFQNFLGKSNIGVVMNNANQNHSVVAPNIAYARLEFQAGVVRGRTGSASGPTNDKFTWRIGGSDSNYEIRATYVSGTVPSGSTMNTWHAPGTNSPFWSLQQGVNGSTSGTFTVEVRPAGGGATLASSTFTLNVDRSP